MAAAFLKFRLPPPVALRSPLLTCLLQAAAGSPQNAGTAHPLK
jgi:hypothetical protein